MKIKMPVSNLIATVLLFLITDFFVACNIWRNQDAANSGGVNTSEQIIDTTALATQIQNPVDQILMLSFVLSHDSLAVGEERCDLMNKQSYNGRMKKALTPLRSFVEEGDLICNFYDRNGKIISTHIEEDPLTASVEVGEENGTISRHHIKRDRAELVLRIQQIPELDQLIVGKVLSNNTIITLITLKL